MLESAFSKRVKIDVFFAKGHELNLDILYELSDFLLDDKKQIVSPQILLEEVLSQKSALSISNEEVSVIAHDKEKLKKKQELLDKCFEKGAYLGNSLQVYFDEHHAFLRLDCQDCDQGKAASLYAGMYPGKVIIVDEVNQEKKGPETTEKGWITYNLVGYLFSTPTQSADPKIEQRYVIMNEFGGGVLSKEKFGFSDLDSNREYLDLLNMPSKKYNISSDKASELFGRIERLVNTCDKELEYQVFGSNCADFVQDMYSRAGLEGDVLEDVYGFRYPQNIFGVYKAITDFHDSISPPSKTQETQKNEPLSYVDLTSQILLGSVVVPYVAAGISSSVKSASEFLYDNIFGKKLEDAEKQVQLEEIDKAKPDLLKSIIAEKKEFEKLYKDIYGENIKIANEEYDERAHKYKSARGEIAIKKVR